MILKFKAQNSLSRQTEYSMEEVLNFLPSSMTWTRLIKHSFWSFSFVLCAYLHICILVSTHCITCTAGMHTFRGKATASSRLAIFPLQSEGRERKVTSIAVRWDILKSYIQKLHKTLLTSRESRESIS